MSICKTVICFEACKNCSVVSRIRTGSIHDLKTDLEIASAFIPANFKPDFIARQGCAIFTLVPCQLVGPLKTISVLCHKSNDVLNPHKRGRLQMNCAVVSLLVNGLDGFLANFNIFETLCCQASYLALTGKLDMPLLCPQAKFSLPRCPLAKSHVIS